MDDLTFGPIWDHIQQIRESKWVQAAIKLSEKYIISNPSNQEALLQLVDLYYTIWELEKAEKPVDFLLAQNDLVIDKTLLYYIKSILAVDRTKWLEAKNLIKKALTNDPKNPEFLRVYGLSEFWSWNKSKWFDILMKAFKFGKVDAEILLDLVSIAMKIEKFDTANKYVDMYFQKRNSLKFFTRSRTYYDTKMTMYKKFLIKKIKKSWE